MINCARGRRRTTLSLRRRIILKESVSASEARKALIVRWIGAAARRRVKIARADARPVQAFDNVTTLTWAQTSGRKARRELADGQFSAIVLEMQAKPAERRAADVPLFPMIRKEPAVPNPSSGSTFHGC